MSVPYGECVGAVVLISFGRSELVVAKFMVEAKSARKNPMFISLMLGETSYSVAESFCCVGALESMIRR